MSRFLLFILVAVVLTAAGAAGPGGVAAAQGCLSPQEARAAVMSGQVVPLGRIVGQVRGALGGQILPPPQLCQIGGRFVYMINVLQRNGRVTRITIDASSGAVVGY